MADELRGIAEAARPHYEAPARWKIAGASAGESP
jgi:hypothetical protein